MQWIDPTGLDKFGNMTVISPGLENLFDGSTVTSARSSGLVGWAGMTFSEPTKINRVDVTSNELGFNSSALVSDARLRLWGSTAIAAPSGSIDGVCLYDRVVPDSDSIRSIPLISADQNTLFRHGWVTLNVNSAFARATKLDFYESVVPAFRPVLGRPTQRTRFIGPFKIPVVAGPPYDHQVVASLFIPDIKAGDEIDPEAEFQVSSEIPANVMCSSCLVLAYSPNDGDVGQWELELSELNPGEVVKINNHNGQNFHGAAEHHFTKARNGVLIANHDVPGGLFLNLVVYAARSQAGASDFITLNSALMNVSHQRFAEI